MNERLDDVVVLCSLLPHVGIGADSKAMHGDAGFLRPFGQCLRERVEARNEEEDPLPRTCDLLGNLEARERLASAACHDQLATLSS